MTAKISTSAFMRLTASLKRCARRVPSETIPAATTGSRSASTAGTAEFIKEAAAFLRERSDVMGGCRWATVAGRDALYGMARMFSTFSEGTSVSVAAFSDYEDARRWLAGHPPEM